MDTEWLYYYLCTVDMGDLSRTTSLPSLRLSELSELEVPVPTIAKQRHLVGRIKECMERVEEIDDNTAKIACELDALFPSLLNGRFAEIQANHAVCALEEAADIRGGSSLPKGHVADSGASSVLLVKVGDMNAGGNERVVQTAREFLPRTEAGRAVINIGAVIFPKRGGAIATNKKRLLGRPALIDPNLMALEAKKEAISADYLYYWCQTLDLAKLSNGGVIPQLNRKDLAPLKIPVPDVTTQIELVENLQRAEAYCAQLKVQFSEAQAERVVLRHAILRKAFAAEL